MQVVSCAKEHLHRHKKLLSELRVGRPFLMYDRWAMQVLLKTLSAQDRFLRRYEFGTSKDVPIMAVRRWVGWTHHSVIHCVQFNMLACLLALKESCNSCTYICTHTHTHTCTHARTYTHTHIHAYTHTHTQKWHSTAQGFSPPASLQCCRECHTALLCMWYRVHACVHGY